MSEVKRSICHACVACPRDAFCNVCDPDQSALEAALAREAGLKSDYDLLSVENDRLLESEAALREELASAKRQLTLHDEEIWRDVKDYEGKYLVSNMGRVKALPFDGPGKRNRSVIRWFSTDRYGYHRLNLALRGKKSNFLVHRLVAIAFIDNPDNKDFVNHIDGNKLNNHVSNLEWVSSQENNLHVCRVLRKRVKPVTSICLKTGARTHYPSFKSAHDLGFNRSSIAKCIAGKLDSHCGFKWIDTQPTESGTSDKCASDGGTCGLGGHFGKCPHVESGTCDSSKPPVGSTVLVCGGIKAIVKAHHPDGLVVGGGDGYIVNEWSKP